MNWHESFRTAAVLFIFLGAAAADGPGAAFWWSAGCIVLGLLLGGGSMWHENRRYGRRL